MSNKLTLRALGTTEVTQARNLFCRHVDFHACHVVERLPSFFDIARLLDPDPSYAERQRVVVGALVDREIIGVVSIERTQRLAVPELDDSHPVWSHFSDHDIEVYCTLAESLARTYIGAPPDTLTAHSLVVIPEYRKRGIARSLLAHAITELTSTERSSLYIETARLKWLIKICTSLGFVPVHSTLSLSERLEYGCWGSVLFKYRSDMAHNQVIHPSREVGRFDSGESLVATG